MDQPRTPPAPDRRVDTVICAGGLRRHGPISGDPLAWVPRTRRCSCGYVFLAPPKIWGRGARNATRPTPSTAF